MKKSEYKERLDRHGEEIVYLRRLIVGWPKDDAGAGYREHIRRQAIAKGEEDPWLGLQERIARLEKNFRQKEGRLVDFCSECGQPRPQSSNE